MALDWQARPDVPDSGFWDATTMVGYNGKLYAYSGYSSTLAIFDVTTQIWSLQSAPSLTGDNWAAALLDGKIWVVNWTGRVGIYDIATDSWATSTWTVPVLTASTRGTPAAVVVAGRVYLYVQTGSGSVTDRVAFMIFDPAVFGTVSMSASNVHKTTYRHVVTDGAVIYGVEGFLGDWDTVGLQSSSQSDTGVVETYDPAANTWAFSSHTDPLYRNDHAAVWHDGKIYVIGGGSDDDNYAGGYSVPWVTSYTVATDAWAVETPLPVPRADPVACVLDGVLYVLGGYSNGELPDPEASLIRSVLGGGTGPTPPDPDLRVFVTDPNNARYVPVA